MKYIILSDKGESNTTESMETFPSASSSTNEGPSDDDAHYLRNFLPRWKILFPWGEYEDGETDCCDCREAGLKNKFVRGKDRPLRGWKKEYLRRHADSRDHTKYAPW